MPHARPGRGFLLGSACGPRPRRPVRGDVASCGATRGIGGRARCVWIYPQLRQIIDGQRAAGHARPTRMADGDTRQPSRARC